MSFDEKEKIEKNSDVSEKGFGLDNLGSCMQELKNLEKQKKGSDEFSDVKHGLETILQYKNLQVPKTTREFYLATTLIKKEYENLFNSINKYNNRKFIAFWSQGKRRKSVINMIRSYAKKEFDTISEAFDGVDSEKLENKTWGDIIKDARVTKLKVNSSTEKTGANTSDVLIINEGNGKKGFFKKEERLGTAKQEIIKYIEESNEIKNKKNLKKYFDKMFSTQEYTKALSVLSDMSGELSNQKSAEGKLKYLQGRGAPVSKVSEVKDYELCLKKAAKLGLLNGIATDNVGIAQDSVISSRNVATSRLAGLVGSDDVVAKSKLAIVENENTHETFRGNVMEEAEGVAAGTFIRSVALGEGSLNGKPLSAIKKVIVRGKVLKQLIDLQTLDSMAWQVDRHAGNYHFNVSLEGDPPTSCVIESIKGIDNDLSFGRKKLSLEGKNYRKRVFDIRKRLEEKERNEQDPQKKEQLKEKISSHDVNSFNRMIFFNDFESGESTLPHMSEDTAKNILGLDDTIIKYMFFDILSEEEIDALVERVTVIKEAIKKSRDKKESFLVKNDSWDQSTFEGLLSSSSANYVKNSLGILNHYKKIIIEG